MAEYNSEVFLALSPDVHSKWSVIRPILSLGNRAHYMMNNVVGTFLECQPEYPKITKPTNGTILLYVVKDRVYAFD